MVHYIYMEGSQIINFPKKYYTVKTVISGHSKLTPKIGFQDRLSLNAGQKYCRMLQWEHPAILLTFIKLPFVIKTYVLSSFEWPPKDRFYSISFSEDKFCLDKQSRLIMLMWHLILVFTFC